MKSEWLTDEERLMIQKCISGDPKYEKILYSKYIKAMYSRAVRMMSDHESAKDAVQEAFIDVFKSLPKFRGESTLGAWIKKILVRTCIKHLKLNARAYTEDLIEDKGTLVSDENDSNNDISAKLIHNSIQKLPDGCRTIFNLYLIEGYKHEEIAMILDISLSTSKTQYRRAKMLLREIIKKYQNE